MPYAILRFSKHKGHPARSIQAHHEREKETYKSNPDIDMSRTCDNVHLVTPVHSYAQEINIRIKNSGCRTRKDSTRFVDTLITASHEFFLGKEKSEITRFFKRSLEFIQKRILPDRIFSAVIHLDEKTPHLHLCFVPLTEDNRLSAKEILGNRAALSKWQDDFYDYMRVFYPELERGVSSNLTHKKHLPVSVFKAARKLQAMQIEIEELLENTNVFNSSKNSKKALQLIEEWVPMVETFQTKVNMLNQSLKESEQSKKLLTRELKLQNSEANGYKYDLIIIKHELERMKRLYDRVPQDIRKQIENKQKSKERNR